MKICIHSIGSQYCLEDESYQWLLDNLEKPLPVYSLAFDKDGRLYHISIYDYRGSVTTVHRDNNVTFDLDFEKEKITCM